MAPVSTPILFAFVAFHAAALACAWGTRLAIGSRIEGLVHTAFFAALAAVGFVTWSVHQAEPGLGVPSGATLIAMVLMAVIDCRRTHEPARDSHLAGGR